MLGAMGALLEQMLGLLVLFAGTWLSTGVLLEN